MKKVLLSIGIIVSSVGYSQNCGNIYNTYQPYNYNNNYNSYYQQPPIITYQTSNNQYSTPLGGLFESIIRTIAVNKINSNVNQRMVNNCCSNSQQGRRKRKIAHKCH